MLNSQTTRTRAHLFVSKNDGVFDTGLLKVKILYLVMSPQYHSASCSEYTGGEGQLLFMVEDTGFVDLGGRAREK